MITDSELLFDRSLISLVDAAAIGASFFFRRASNRNEVAMIARKTRPAITDPTMIPASAPLESFDDDAEFSAEAWELLEEESEPVFDATGAELVEDGVGFLSTIS